MLNNTHHPRFPSGAKALHILHTPSVPSASSSFVFSKAQSSPGSLSIFQRSEGLAQVAMKRRYSSAKLFRPRRYSVDTYLSSFIRLLSYPGNTSSSTLAFLFHSYPVAPGHAYPSVSPSPFPIQE
jgi:hypothetical protein